MRFSKQNLLCPIYNNSTEGGGGGVGGWTITIRSMKDWNNLDKAPKKKKDTKSFQKSVINTLLERRKETDKFGTPFQILY